MRQFTYKDDYRSTISLFESVQFDFAPVEAAQSSNPHLSYRDLTEKLSESLLINANMYIRPNMAYAYSFEAINEVIMSIETQIRNFLNHALLFNEDGSIVYSDDESFLKRNLIDSTTVMEIVLFVEETFQLEIADSEIVPDNFDSINKIAQYIRQKTAMRQNSVD